MLVDANVLLFARDASSPFHERALRWLTDAINGQTRVGLPWASLLAFQRIATHPRAFERPLAPDAAWQQVREWLDAEGTWVVNPTDRHAQVLGELLERHRPTGNAIPDCHLAALAIEHGIGVCSADTDFARFTGLRWINPLVS